MLEKFEKFRSQEIGSFSYLSLLRLVLYLIILYCLFNYYMYVSVVVISLVLLIVSFFLPYSNIHGWGLTIISIAGTVGVASFLFLVGLSSFGIYILLIGISISGWLIPAPSPVIADSMQRWLSLVNAYFVLFLIWLTSLFPSAPQQEPQSEMVLTINKETEIVSTEAAKIDDVYSAQIRRFLTAIGREAGLIVSNREKLVEFLGSELVSKAGDNLGVILMLVIRKLVAEKSKRGLRIGGQKEQVGCAEEQAKDFKLIDEDIQKITDFLAIVHKCRKTEIRNATGLSEDETDGLLKLLKGINVLVCEKGGFWRFRMETDKI